MKYETIEVTETFHGITITMNKPEKGNPINNTLLAEINRVLDLAEKDPDTRVVVLESQGGVFCTGLDFEEVAQAGETTTQQQSNPYMQTFLKHYFRKMWLITEQMEETAVSEIRRLLAQPKVLQDITNYVKYRKFPWE